MRVVPDVSTGIPQLVERAMSFRNSSSTRVERVVSFVSAIGVTVIAGLVMMLAPGNGFLAAFSVRPSSSTAPDRVVYVAPNRSAPPPAAVSRPQPPPTQDEIDTSSARRRSRQSSHEALGVRFDR